MENRRTQHYKRFLAAANGYLERKELDDAERAFASALKQINRQENTLYETAVALQGLGFVYKKRGSIHKRGEDLVKASGLFISALSRLEGCGKNEENLDEGNPNDALLRTEIARLEKEIGIIHEMFITEILESQLAGVRNDHQNVEHYKDSWKKSLEQIRDVCRSKIKAMENMPPLDPDKRDVTVERERAEYIKCVYIEIAKAMRAFITSLVNDCVQVMTSPPCRYSILGLGSMAREEATPYSDLEFCILVEEDTEEVLQYFSNLTNFLHLKVVELGETILPSLGIKSLNDYYSGDGTNDWFFDSGLRGFSFDGAMPWASKVPTGRDKTVDKPWAQSLIKTPRGMASLLSETSIHKEGYRLADVLSTCVLICGDRSLFEDYGLCKREVLIDSATSSTAHLCENSSRESNEKTFLEKQRILEELVEVGKQYHTSIANYFRKTGGSYAVKKDFYRFPSLVVEYIGLYYNIESSSSWITIDELDSAKHLSSDGAHNLRVALGIAAELRLRAYLDNQSQNENSNELLALVAKQDVPNDLAMLLHRFFFTVVPLEEAIRKVPERGNLLHLKDSDLYDNNPKIKAQMYLQFKQYYKATEILQDVVAEKLQLSSNKDADQALGELCKILGNAFFFLENGQEAIKYHGLALKISERIFKNNSIHCNLKVVGDSLLNYGNCLTSIGEKRKALPYFSKSLEIRRSFLERSSTTLERITSLQDLVDVQANLSKVYSSPASDEVSLFFYHNQQALDICEILLQEYNVVYYLYHFVYSAQGLTYYNLGMFQESAKAYEKALEIIYKHRKYELFTDTEAAVLNNLGNTMIQLGNLDKARSLHTRAYEIRTQIHGGRDHNSLARSLNNFGLISETEGNIREAHEFYIQARDMAERIHGRHSLYEHEHLQMYRRNVKKVAGKLRD